MTRVDFYVLAEQARGDRFLLCCRLADKIWQQGRRVLILAPDQEHARHLDRLLWTWRQGGFPPHGMVGEADPATNPILISSGEDVADEHDVLVNLGSELPGFFSRFERLLECVDHDPDVRSRCREHYSFLKSRGYPIETHQID
jgi:DNA polymerase-3 subunit chi